LSEWTRRATLTFRRKQMADPKTHQSYEESPTSGDPKFNPVMPERPDVLKGTTPSIRTGCGKMYPTINFTPDGKPVEVFARLGKAGGCASSQCEAIGRLASAMLRYGMPVEIIIDQLQGICCSSGGGEEKRSCADAIAYALKTYATEGAKP
jgi:ribonucleoside-diphosphate reductase alpha chain